MILHDPYALNRKWWLEDWEPQVIDREWTDWDYVLADTFRVIQDFTDQTTGQLMWYDQSGDVRWNVMSRFRGSEAALDAHRKTLKDGEGKPGEDFYVVPEFNDPENKPTLESWLKDMEENRVDLRPAGTENLRPPTREEINKARAERNKAKRDSAVE